MNRQDFVVKKNQTILLDITGMTAEGYGVGHYCKFAVFVPLAAVGDQLEVKIVKVQQHLAYGIIEKILNPASVRMKPDCPVFGRCGGCAFRHISYSEECRVKEQIVEDAFTRIGHFKTPILPILKAQTIEEYRNKAQYPCGKDPATQELCFGFYAPRSHRLIPIADCRLQPKIFREILDACKNLLKDIPPYDETTETGVLRHLYLRKGYHSGEMMLCFVVAKDIRQELTTAGKSLMKQFPNIVSVMMNCNHARTNVILGKQTICLCGKPTISDTICDVPIQISPQSFYQVHTEQAERLFKEVQKMANPQGHEQLLDLYCGTGVIGLSMAKMVSQVIGVEIVPQAVENARINAMRAGIKNARFYAGDAKLITAKLAEERIKPDFIFLDPPRKGCDMETLQSCVRMNAPCIVMISCNPATAARDAKMLCENGYTLQAIRPVDMFPRTAHVECIVLMSRIQD